MEFVDNDSLQEDLRFLAGSASYEQEKNPLDYTVFSVGIMTLVMILVVELIRHQLDHATEHSGRFFKNVLESVYSECKILDTANCRKQLLFF